MAKITEKQRLFVKYYIIDFNASQAALKAGYSKHTARNIGNENLTKPIIKQLISAEIDKRAQRVEITQDMVLLELARIGFSNIGNYTTWNESGVSVVPSDQLTDDAKRCVSEIVHQYNGDTGSGTVKFKLHDKVAALEKIARHLGMFDKDRLSLTGDPNNPVAFTTIEIQPVKPLQIEE